VGSFEEKEITRDRDKIKIRSGRKYEDYALLWEKTGMRNILRDRQKE
jgi:hypothetical protein